MPQLCICSREEQWAICRITSEPMIHQLTRVLRMRKGDMFFVQDVSWTRRLRVTITQLQEQMITAQIDEIYTPSWMRWSPAVGVIVAMPNKFEKLELIVQKLSEIGVDYIWCWPSRRSLLRELPEKKVHRLEAIAREATEQSRGWTIPQISFSNVFPQLDTATVLLCDGHAQRLPTIPVYTAAEYVVPTDTSATLRSLIWPEGGFTDEEVMQRSSMVSAQIVLWSQVLRMETAAIVAARWMKQIRGEDEII